MTIFGFIGCIYFTWQSRNISIQGLFNPSKLKVLLAGLIFLLYWVTPPLLWSGAIQADNHFIETLRQKEARPGKPIELDRVLFRINGDQLQIQTLWGDEFVSVSPQLPATGTLSVRGIFTDTHQIQITDYHLHRSGWRDGASILGLTWIVFFVFFKTRWCS